MAEEQVPLERWRRTMSTVMSNAWQKVALTTVSDDADITKWGERENIAIRSIRALVAACHAEPALNIHYNDIEETRIFFGEEVHIGLAVDSEHGLYVPVIRNAHMATPSDIRQIVADFQEKARDKRFTLDDFAGATITLSNFGPIAGKYATPLIVPPQVAVLGIGRRYENSHRIGTIHQHYSLPLSLSFDHRVVSGGEAARFLKAAIADLELPS